MSSIEQEERYFPRLEAGDQESTYEHNNGNDSGNKTVYNGKAKQSNNKKKPHKHEEVIFHN